MVELWFKIKIIMLCLSVAFAAAIIFAVVTSIVMASIKFTRKTSWLEKNGFTRELFDVPSCGGGAFYGWRLRDTEGKIIKQIDERDMGRIKYKDFVKQMTISEG